MKSFRWFLSTALLISTLATAHGINEAAAEQPATSCGNGHLDAGETCASCGVDCTVRACTPRTPARTFAVRFEAPFGTQVSSATVLVGYDSSRASVPGAAGEDRVRKRITNVQKNAIVVTNDLDYALRAVFTRPGGIENGRLFMLEFDQCQGTPAPKAPDFGCTVEGCASAAGPVAGCTCSLDAP